MSLRPPHHLRNAEETQRLRARVVTLWNSTDLTLTTIAYRLGISRNTVSKLLNEARENGEQVRERENA